MALFGGIVLWAGVHERGFGSALSLVGLGLLVAAAALALLPWILPGADPRRWLVATVTSAMALGCLALAGVAAAHRDWGTFALLPPVAGICAIATLLTLEPEWVRRHGSRRWDRRLGGVAAVLAGLAISAGAGLAGTSPGVPGWAGAIAGGSFLIAGLMLLLGERRGGTRDGVGARLLAALLVSLLAAIAVGVAGPLGLAAVVVSGPSWLAVFRKLRERRGRRDPFAGRGEAQVLGVGCLVGLLLAALVATALGLAARPSTPPLPAEAPDLAAPPAR